MLASFAVAGMRGKIVVSRERTSPCLNYVKIRSSDDGSSSPRTAPNVPPIHAGAVQKGGFCPFCSGNESKTPPEVLAYRPNGGPPAPANSPAGRCASCPTSFPALGIEGNLNRQAEGMFDKMNGIGAHEVIIETPEHDVTLADLPEKRIEDVLWAFRDRIVDLKKDRRFKYILIFKNHGDGGGRYAGALARPIDRAAHRSQARGGGTGGLQAILHL